VDRLLSVVRRRPCGGAKKKKNSLGIPWVNWGEKKGHPYPPRKADQRAGRASREISPGDMFQWNTGKPRPKESHPCQQSAYSGMHRGKTLRISGLELRISGAQRGWPCRVGGVKTFTPPKEREAHRTPKKKKRTAKKSA